MKCKQLLIFMPVVHAGYVDLLSKHADADEILLLGESFSELFPSMTKEIRALTPAIAATQILAILPDAVVRVVNPGDLALSINCQTLVMPDEEIMRELAERFSLGVGRDVVWERTFLRWDRPWSRPQPVDGLAPASDLSADDLSHIARARELAERSSDWWRQVGAVLLLPDGTVMEAYNRHHPTEYAPYLVGDPRNEFHRGERMDLSTALHAEAGLIARAAKDGTSVRGGKLYVTTFPCPSCARMVAVAGIAACFFEAPYAVLAGDEILRTAGVELHWVPTPESDHP